MSTISVRLPPEIEHSLEEEARRTRRNRSELVREAVGEYLTRKEKQRLIDEMQAAARTLYSSPEALRRGVAIAEAGVEDWFESIEVEERAAGVDAEEQWWD